MHYTNINHFKQIVENILLLWPSYANLATIRMSEVFDQVQFKSFHELVFANLKSKVVHMKFVGKTLKFFWLCG